MAMVVENCDDVLLTMDSLKSVLAPFLKKTYQLVDDSSTDHIVSWGVKGTSFVVWRLPEFARDLLPYYFKHNNFSSFVRQLNTYRFRKIVADRWEFSNELFRKGKKHLLCEIHRKKTPSQPPPPPPSVQQLRISGHHPPFLPFPPRMGCIPPADPDDLPARWCASDLSPSAIIPLPCDAAAAVSALSEDNERLRRSNTLLLSELAHMKKLYNDIIYFVQNHVRPVAPRAAAAASGGINPGFQECRFRQSLNACSTSGSSTVTLVEEHKTGPRLFGVSLQGRKRQHHDQEHDDDDDEDGACETCKSLKR